MSGRTSPSTDIDALTRRLHVAENSVAFIQREHASTLISLHEEIAKWQHKCSGQYDKSFSLLVCHASMCSLDLTFQLAMDGTRTHATDTSKFPWKGEVRVQMLDFK